MLKHRKPFWCCGLERLQASPGGWLRPIILWPAVFFQVEAVMDVLLMNNKIRAATHNIMAYRIEQPEKGTFQQVGRGGLWVDLGGVVWGGR